MDEIRLGSRTLQPHRQLLVNGSREPLGKRALDILSVLAEAKGEIVTKDELLAAVWPGVTVEENALQVHIVALRKALGPEAARLRTIRGVGYQLEVEPAGSGTDEPTIPASPPPAGAAATAPTIVVLPFDNMSADPEQDYFADGITEDIITDLSHVSALKVIARNSAFAFRGQHTDTREVARQLGASHVMQGSVRRSGGRLRVSAQLIDGATNDHLWAQRYDRDMADIFDLQDELAEAIVSALKVNLLPSERNEIGARNTVSPEAYDLYVRARALRATMQMDNIRQSVEAYRAALAIDPDFAMAWAGLASALLNNRGLFPGSGIDLADVDEALARAVELAPDLPEVAASRAARCMFELDWPGLEQCIAVFEQRPDAGWSIHSHALLMLGRASEAADQQAKVWRSDPLSPGATWALQYHLDCAGRLDAAETEYQKSHDLSGMRAALEWEATKRMMVRGEHDKVRARFAWFRQEGERFGLESRLVANLDDPDAMRQVLREALADPASQYQIRLDTIAHWATYLGDDDLALTALRRTTIETRGMMAMGMWHPNLARVRRNPKFKAILSDIGLADHWRQTGNWGEFVRPVSESDFEVVA